jgi:hypothetical protein
MRDLTERRLLHRGHEKPEVNLISDLSLTQPVDIRQLIKHVLWVEPIPSAEGRAFVSVDNGITSVSALVCSLADSVCNGVGQPSRDIRHTGDSRTSIGGF